jgi:CHAT domain-containing protein
MRIVKEGTSFHSNISNNVYADALFSMYENLVKPIESDIVGKKIIVIPDEEIAYLPFDSFIEKKPVSKTVSFDELSYLIYDYTISYGFTSSLLGQTESKGNPSVVAFLPDYSDDNAKSRFTNLSGATNEILEISKYFKTERIKSKEATESKFMSKVNESNVLHLAMHSCIDKNNSKYSYLVFDSVSDKQNDGRLYNYEIGNTRIKSPMVVLSACNTGDGNLIEGEGIMSLARGFFLAGVPSIICTYWDVNDDASEKIMAEYYYHLSKGEEKSEALRKSKLEYLSVTPPAYSKPSYWAAYEVLGDNSLIVNKPKYWLYFLLGLSTTGLVAGVYYFRRSRRS